MFIIYLKRINNASQYILKQEKILKIIHGDCLAEMKKMKDNSIDCIVTDPPYGLSFMGKKWDKEVPSVIYWKEMLRISKPGSFLLAAGAPRSHHHLSMAIENAGWEITDCIMHIFATGFPKGKSQLKPAYEPWILARKKADKVQHLNIDDSRIGTEEIKTCEKKKGESFTSLGKGEGYNGCPESKHIGRWPSNIILGDEEVEAMLDEQSGILKSGSHDGLMGKLGYRQGTSPQYSKREKDSGGASRFFYCAKASRSERQDSKHPTIKPKKLMTYLIKLVAPKGDPIILDPFMGSGTTGVVCKELGYRFIGIEKEKEYFEDAKRRINLVDVPQYDLFDLSKQDCQSNHSKDCGLYDE